MKRRKKRTIRWSLAGLLFTLAVLLVVVSGISGQVLITDSSGISKAADAVMTAVQNGDWDTLEMLVAEAENLQPATGEEGSAEELIWEAYRNSLTWTCMEGYEVHGAEITQKLTISCLDISALTRRMIEILPEMTADTAEAHVLIAAKTALSQDLPTLQKDITMTFIRRDGQWKLLPNKTLLALLSGFTAA